MLWVVLELDVAGSSSNSDTNCRKLDKTIYPLRALLPLCVKWGYKTNNTIMMRNHISKLLNTGSGVEKIHNGNYLYNYRVLQENKMLFLFTLHLFALTRGSSNWN